MGTGLSGTIVFSSGKQGDQDIWSLDLATDKLLQLTKGSSWNDKPRWSPDGRWVVYVGNAEGTPDIYKVRADGSGEPVPVIRNDRWNDFPAFSPDGAKLGFVSNMDGDVDLWIAEPDGTNAQCVLSHPGDDSFFAWDSSGDSIVFSGKRGDDREIFRYDLSSDQPVQLTHSPGLDIHPAPSPSGDFIAFVSDRQQAREKASKRWSEPDLDVWLMRADGADPVRVTENQGADRCVAWSPDGKRLIYSASASGGGAERLRIVDIEPVVTAYGSGAEAAQRAANRLRERTLELDRKTVEQDIGANLIPTLVSKILPDRLDRLFYGEQYFGSERFPDWHAKDAAQSQLDSEVA